VYFDSHLHLDFAAFDGQRGQVLSRAAAAQVSDLFVPGTNPQAWRRLQQLVSSGWECGGEPPTRISVGVGVHPYWSDELDYGDARVLTRVMSEAGDHVSLLGARAIGEIGLDKHRGAPAAAQISLFEAQLGLAKQLELPVVLHQVGMQREFLETLRRVGLPYQGGVLHGFSGDVSWANTVLRLGLLLGVGAGIVHPARARLRQTVAQLPLDRLLIETDAPDGRLRETLRDVAPGAWADDVRLRCIHSEPADVVLVAEQLASLHACSVEEVARITHQHSSLMFRR